MLLKILSFAIVFLTLGNITSAPADELRIFTENLPPLNYVKDGKLVGPSVDIVREIQRRIGSKSEIQVLPWARAYKMSLEEKNIVLFGMTQTKSRQNLFKWVGPLATKRDILIARKDSHLLLTELEDAKKVSRIGTLRDDTRERYLLSHGFSNLESVSNDQLNAKKLALGRLDLWAYKIPGFKTVCELAGVDHNQFEEVYHLRTIDVSIAFSKQTSDDIVAKWRTAFEEMLEDGTVENLRIKWSAE